MITDPISAPAVPTTNSVMFLGCSTKSPVVTPTTACVFPNINLSFTITESVQ